MYRGILARFQNFSVCVLVFVFVFLYLYVLHPGAVPQWSLYPGLSKNIAYVWSIVSFYFRAEIQLLRGGGGANTLSKFCPKDDQVHKTSYNSASSWKVARVWGVLRKIFGGLIWLQHDQVELERVKRVETELSEEQVANALELILIIVTFSEEQEHSCSCLTTWLWCGEIPL